MIFTETDIQYIKNKIAQTAISDSSLQKVTTMKNTDIMPIVYYEQSGSGKTPTNRTITKQDFFKNNDDITEVNFKKGNITAAHLNIKNGAGSSMLEAEAMTNLVTFRGTVKFDDLNTGSINIIKDTNNSHYKVFFYNATTAFNVIELNAYGTYPIYLSDLVENKVMHLGITASGITRTFTNATSDYTKLKTSMFYNTAGRATYFQSLNTGAISRLIDTTKGMSSSDESYNSNIMTYVQLIQDELPSLPSDFLKGDTRNTYVSLIDLVEYTTQLKQYIKEEIAAAVNRKQNTEMNTEMDIEMNTEM